jgi:hypothetical protein
VHRMIEQSIVHLPELVKDIERPVSIYLVHLSRRESSITVESSEERRGRVLRGFPPLFRSLFTEVSRDELSPKLRRALVGSIML